MDLLKVGKEDELTLDRVISAFGDYQDGGDEFKCLFVMFSVSSLLSPNSERKVDKSLFKVLEDVSKLPMLDWCTFVLERLCTAVRRYFDNSSQTVVNGCVLVLLISYLHRLPFQGIRAPTNLPLVRNWVDDEVKMRANKELLVGYGKGIVDITTFPISKVYSQWAAASTTFVSVSHDMQTNISRSDIMPKPCAELGGSSSGFIHYAIPNNLLHDAVIKEGAKDPLDEANQIFKRDIEVVTAEYMKKLAMFELVKKQQSQGQSDSLSQEEIISQTQLIMQDPVWQANMDELVNNMLKKSTFLVASGLNGDNNVAPRSTQTVNRTNVEPNNPLLDESMLEHLDDIVQPNENLSSSHEHNIEPDLCSIDLGPKDINVLLVSKFMKENKLPFMGLRKLEKQVADYCFLAETTLPNEVLASFSVQHFLQRLDILSLESFKKIDPKIIECWALYLNEMARTCTQHPVAFCFWLSHVEPLENVLLPGEICTQKLDYLHNAWKQWVDFNNHLWDLSKVEMFFVPFYHNERFCLVVVNIAAEMVHFWDNIRHDDNEFSYTLSRTVRDHISDFLESVNHPNASDVVGYGVESLNFKWAVDENNDDGVYTMYFMEQFDGSTNLTPLSKSLQRRYYRASICARLVTCDLNNRRNHVLKSVADFTINKEHLKPNIEKERKIRRQNTNVGMRKSKRVPRK